MKNTGGDVSQVISSGVTEKEWIAKKSAVLTRLSRVRSGQKIDRENLTSEKEKVMAEVERLEKENQLMARSVKDYQLQLSEKRRKAQIQFQRSDNLKKKLRRMIARQRSLFDEIKYYESEKARLSETCSEVSKMLKRNISVLDSRVNDIGFTKGEIETLINKMRMLEDDVPAKARGLDSLDVKITEITRILPKFYERMQGIERKLKMNYYNIKK